MKLSKQIRMPKCKCFGCSNIDVQPCTKQPEPADWIEEFKKIWKNDEWKYNEAVNFISTQIAKARKEEREKIKELLRKERDTWAKESIGDKALQSFENAFNQLT